MGPLVLVAIAIGAAIYLKNKSGRIAPTGFYGFVQTGYQGSEEDKVKLIMSLTADDRAVILAWTKKPTDKTVQVSIPGIGKRTVAVPNGPNSPCPPWFITYNEVQAVMAAFAEKNGIPLTGTQAELVKYPPFKQLYGVASDVQDWASSGFGKDFSDGVSAVGEKINEAGSYVADKVEDAWNEINPF